MRGWIKVHRSIQEHWLYKEKPFDRRSAWNDLILSANHKDNKFPLGNELVTVKRGSFITSIRKLSEKWGWSNTKTRSFLNLLVDDGMLVVKSDTKKTTLTICNYNVYQEVKTTENATETPQKHHQNATETPPKHTNKNDKNDKNVKNDKNNPSSTVDIYKNIIAAWNALPYKAIPKVTTVNPKTKRGKTLKARVEEYGEAEILKAIELIKQSPFLQGDSDKGWFITFDWFLLPSNFIKVLEGNYVKNAAAAPANIHKTKNHLADSRTGKYTAEQLERLILQRQKQRG